MAFNLSYIANEKIGVQQAVPFEKVEYNDDNRMEESFTMNPRDLLVKKHTLHHGDKGIFSQTVVVRHDLKDVGGLPCKIKIDMNIGYLRTVAPTGGQTFYTIFREETILPTERLILTPRATGGSRLDDINKRLIKEVAELEQPFEYFTLDITVVGNVPTTGGIEIVQMRRY